jgi:protein-S-isoprenylcysteine O-methyltransferase Ste14
MATDRHDRGSALAIFAGVILAQLAAIIEFGYRDEFRPAPFSMPVLAGLGIAAAGFCLRMWAIRVLGRFFTSTVQVQARQKVIESGPYAAIRHPSYTGALVVNFGIAVTLSSPIGLALILILTLPAYLYRIAVEERALIAGLGGAYEDYRTRTWKLCPYLY